MNAISQCFFCSLKIQVVRLNLESKKHFFCPPECIDFTKSANTFEEIHLTFPFQCGDFMMPGISAEYTG